MCPSTTSTRNTSRSQRLRVHNIPSSHGKLGIHLLQPLLIEIRDDFRQGNRIFCSWPTASAFFVVAVVVIFFCRICGCCLIAFLSTTQSNKTNTAFAARIASQRSKASRVPAARKRAEVTSSTMASAAETEASLSSPLTPSSWSSSRSSSPQRCSLVRYLVRHGCIACLSSVAYLFVLMCLFVCLLPCLSWSHRLF